MTTQRVDWVTIVGLGMLMMPLMTMWHELGGHAAACGLLGGHAGALGAFYVECTGLSRVPDLLVACAGVTVNALLCLVAYALWRRARSDLPRLVLWLLWVSQGFVAAGYFCFSGVTGIGDLGTSPDGALHGVPIPLLWRAAEFAFGIAAYVGLVLLGNRTLTAMIGTGPSTAATRKRIAHGFYATAGICAVIVGLLNPVGIVITITSAAASSFGGLAGFISIGYSINRGEAPRGFVVARSWMLAGLGLVVLLGFALVLGPTIHR
jgi:hypothetical protein